MFTVQTTRMPIFSKVFILYFETPIKTPIFIRNKLYPNDPNDKLFPLVCKIKCETI